MSNSSLATYVDTSTGNWTARKYKITRITIHRAAGVCTLQRFSSILRSGREVSWNYAIANDGSIGLYVDESRRAWTSSNADNDHRAITIEVSNSATGGNWPVSAAAYQSLLKLCEDICRRNNISKLTYTGSLSGSNLTMHQWFAATSCPGPYLKSKFPEIASTVNTRLGLPSSTSGTISSPLNAHDALVLGSVEANQALVATQKLTPYMATIDRRTTSVNYTALQQLGVVGVMIEAGCLYDVTHTEQVYRNPKLNQQVAAASAAKMPFALYSEVKSQTVAEAKKELKQLAYCIYQYPPALGVWLKLQLSKSKTTNNSIIDEYYSKLVEVGLKDKIGLYATPSQLSQIDWSKYCDRFYLWLDRHVSSVSGLDELLTPQFFVV